MQSQMEVLTERRVITALFIDVVGSTDLMMRVGPEVMRRRLADAFSQMGTRIAEHGGTVENYGGDSVFAIFGAPTARVDDAERALRAGQACADWSAATLAEQQLSVRVGIETGEALVDLAAVARHERMAIGACVNIAARLQQHAGPGEIIVGPTARATTASVARFEPLGPVDLKGLGAIETWRLVDFLSADDVARVPFVGRDAELRALVETAERAARGEQVLALVVGAPGLGKSRLVDELLRARLEAGLARVIEARCRPAGEEGSNTPLRQLIDADVPNATPDAVRSRLSQLLDPTEATAAAAAILHSVGLESSPAIQAMTRYEQRVNIAEAWRRYLAAVARHVPLIVSVDDLHWADPVMLFILYHVTSGGDAPLLVVGTARPEFEGSALILPPDSRVQIDLQPLDASAADALAEAARGAVAGLERAAGNPLFIIELARAQSAASGAADIPLTIQAAIAARLDELAPEERLMLQQVSVAGETFDVRDAALLADRTPPEAAGMLGRIAHLGFVESFGHSYRFHHALAHDVAYGRLPVTTRLQLHARYAQEGVPPSDAVGRAFHLWEATKPPDADWAWEDANRLDALRRAAFDAQLACGRLLEGWNQYEQAEVAYSHAVELAPDPAQRGEALANLGRAQVRQGKGDDAWANRLSAIDAYAQAGTSAPAGLYADMLETTTFNWGYFHELPTDELVGRLVDEGLRVARSSDDQVSLARLIMEQAALAGDASGADEVLGFLDSDDAVKFADAAHRLAQVLMWSGEFSRSVALYDRVFNELLPRGGVFNEPESMIWYAQAAFFGGDLQLARAMRDKAQSDLAKGRSVHTQSHVLGIRSLVALGQGDWPELLRVTEEIEALLAAHPDDSFCLVGGCSVGFGGTARLLAGIQLPNDLARDAARMIGGSEMVQASSIMLAEAIRGDVKAVDRGLTAYAPGNRLVDRAPAFDVIHLLPAVAAVMLERWDMLEAPMARLEYCAARGSILAAATIDAIEEERAAKTDRQPQHASLRELGYQGISELLRVRARTRQPASTTV
jgi:class 3 adenylate cyclase/tetratricopeptide (TPR) repeat protein